MKNIIAIVFLLLFSFAFAIEQTPLFIDTAIIQVDVEEDNSSLINIENMNKRKQIEKAKDGVNTNKNSKIKLDTRQIHHQRVLDYMNRPGNSNLLPIF